VAFDLALVGLLCLHFALQKLLDQIRDLITVFFEGKMAGVENMEIEVLQVAFVGMGAFLRKNGIVLSPSDQCRGLMFPKVALPFWVKWGITSIVVEEGQLDLIIPFSIEQVLIVCPGIGTDDRFIPYPSRVLPFSSLDLEESAQSITILWAAILPVGLNRIPEFTETFFIGIAVLDGDAGWESGESVSLLSRTPKARASRQFLECDREAVAFLHEHDRHLTDIGRHPSNDRISCTLFILHP
jgi:hypothetical protein